VRSRAHAEAGLSSRLLPRIHPLLWATHAVLSVAALNVAEVQPLQVVRPLILAWLLTTLLLIALSTITRSYEIGALLASLLVILFFAYGHVYDIVKGETLGPVMIGRHRYLGLAWIAIALAGGFVILRLSDAWRLGVSRFLTASAGVALLLPVSSLILFAVRVGPVQPWQRSAGASLSYDQAGPPPDIYYIIPDSYARTDVMKELYGYDNSDFEAALEARGFYIARQSIPNHVATGFSVAASLNMDYVTDLGIDLPPGSYPGPLIDPIHDSIVRQQLESLGYITVATSTGWAATSIIDADVYLSPEKGLNSPNRSQLLPPISDFESLLMETTMLRLPLDQLQGRQTSALLGRLVGTIGDERHRQLVLSTFDDLQAIPDIKGPKFVFVHLVSPHRPYVFGPEGQEVPQSGPFSLEDITPAEDRAQEFAKYRDQLLFINTKILEAVDTILAKSDPDPIIVIQSDTGPAFGFDWANPDPTNLELKASIFNAYHLPSQCESDLYPQISPVNTFRVIFNCVFGGSYPMLEDYTLYTDHHAQNGYEYALINRDGFTLGKPFK
jgi:hypothetical protein